MSKFYKSKYLYLFGALFFYFISTSLLTPNHYTGIILSLIFTGVIGLCFLTISKNRLLIAFTCLTGFLTVLLHWIINVKYFNQDIKLYVSFYILDIIFLITIIYAVIYSIVSDKRITFDSLFGAICSYLLTGFAWGLIYLLINTIDSTAFSQTLIESTIHESLKKAFYYSFTTLTTLGYGDILPTTDIARTASWIEAVVGQIYLVVWISELVGRRIIQKIQN
jgi:hypothetical protein